jgi:hypothetical protein
MSEDMVERVARALWHDRHVDGEVWDEDQHRDYRGHARAAIAAMRHTTQAMWDHARRHMDSSSSNAAWWQKMIDGALLDAALSSNTKGEGE